MKKFLLLAGWFLFSDPLLASDFEDKLHSIEWTYTTLPALQAEFIQETYSALTEETISRSGRLFYKKGGKIRIEYAASPMTHYISDGKLLWIVRPEDNRHETYLLKNSGLPEEALNFLTELGGLRRYFKVSKGKEGKIILKPKKKSSYKRLDGLFNAGHLLEKLTIRTRAGNTSHYRFFNLQTKKDLPDRLFRFSSPPSPGGSSGHSSSGG